VKRGSRTVQDVMHQYAINDSQPMETLLAKFTSLGESKNPKIAEENSYQNSKQTLKFPEYWGKSQTVDR